MRGRQLGESNELYFDSVYDKEFRNELRIPSAAQGRQTWVLPNSSDWRALPSGTYVRAPGCYAYQVDGFGFSEVIVFEARPMAGQDGS